MPEKERERERERETVIVRKREIEAAFIQLHSLAWEVRE